VVQNNIGNQYSSRTIIVPATGAEHTAKAFPIQVQVAGEGGLTKPSVILCDQIRAIDKSRVIRVLGRLSRPTMDKVDAAIKVSLALK
jgi:mRNA interferase MazF